MNREGCKPDEIKFFNKCYPSAKMYKFHDDVKHWLFNTLQRKKGKSSFKYTVSRPSFAENAPEQYELKLENAPLIGAMNFSPGTKKIVSVASCSGHNNSLWSKPYISLLVLDERRYVELFSKLEKNRYVKPEAGFIAITKNKFKKKETPFPVMHLICKDKNNIEKFNQEVTGAISKKTQEIYLKFKKQEGTNHGT